MVSGSFPGIEASTMPGARQKLGKAGWVRPSALHSLQTSERKRMKRG